MASGRRSFQRQLGQRRYRKLFILAVEGMRTEPEYFAWFNDESSVIRVECLRGNSCSSPEEVLKRMEERLKREGLRSSDEAWLVVD